MVKASFRAAVVQTLAVLGDIEHNINLVRHYTKEAVGQGAKLVVFPECMNTGYLFDSAQHCADLAEPISGIYVSAIADLCRQYEIYIASGVTEKDISNGKIYNSGVLLDPQGEVILHYQKQFLATHDRNWFEVGNKGCPVVDTELGRIGLLICFDGRIPEIARCLALQKAEILVDMANFFVMDRAEMWIPARAYENGVWIVAATKAGVERSIYYPGGSSIVAPTGHVTAQIPYDTHGVATAEIRLDAYQLHRKLLDRRPDTYQILRKPFAETPLAPLLQQPLVPEQAIAKVAAVQSHVIPEPASLEAAFEMVGHAAKLGAKLIALPQHFNVPTWLPNHEEAKAASLQAFKHLQQAAKITKSYGCALILPLIEQVADALIPTAVLVGVEGEVIGRYHQVHLEPEIRAWAKPGNSFPVFETPFGRIGIILGYDGHFPESTRALALNGADTIAWCCAWQHPFERELLAVPKAADNRVYLVCANRTDCPYPGGSFVISPEGFDRWDVKLAAPPVKRHGAVMPMHVNLALSRQKQMIPKVDMLRNRLVDTFEPLVSSSF